MTHCKMIHWKKRHLQTGFGLLEATLVIAMLSVITVAAFSALVSAQRSAATPQISADMLRSSDTLRGRGRTEFRLPMPDEAVASPGRPGYLEGWLPESAGGGTTQRIRYLVNVALVSAPSPAYLTDASDLLQGEISPRIAANGLDFCLALINEDQSGTSLPGGRRVAYGLQKSQENGAVPRTEFLPDGDPVLETRLLGHAELAADLGCYQAMSDLSASVKDAAVYYDALRLAEEGVAIRALSVRSSEQSVDLLHMRMAIWSVGLTTSSMNIVLANAQLKVHAIVGAVTTGLQIVKNLLTIATMAQYVVDTNERLVAANEGLEKNREKLARSEAYRDSLKRELADRLANIHLAQEKGLQ